MRKIDLLVVVAMVGLGAFWVRPAALKQTTKPTSTSTPLEGPGEDQPALWEVDGATVKDSPEALTARFGKPGRVDRDPSVDQYWFTGSDGGQFHVSYFLKDKTVGISGNVLRRDGKVVVSLNDSADQVRQRLGEPQRMETGKDFVAFQYLGARIYLRDGRVFGVVTEGAGPD